MRRLKIPTINNPVVRMTISNSKSLISASFPARHGEEATAYRLPCKSVIQISWSYLCFLRCSFMRLRRFLFFIYCVLILFCQIGGILTYFIFFCVIELVVRRRVIFHTRAYMHQSLNVAHLQLNHIIH